MLYIKVSIPILLFKTFIYSYNQSKKNLFIGQGVSVKFNNRTIFGFITNISTQTTYKSKIHPILSLNNNSVKINNELIHTINWMANYYVCPIGKTLKATIPYQLFNVKNIQEKYIKITSKGISQLNSIPYKKQKIILDYLSLNKEYVKMNALKTISETYHQSCEALRKKELVEIKTTTKSLNQEEVDDNKKIKKLILTEDQNSIYVNISNQINQNLKQIILSGIPGSGKTELYIKLIQGVISKKQEAIVLVPEISLIKQTFIRLKNIMGNIVGYWHSKLSKNEKKIILDNIKNKKIKIMVGARSCLFMPFNNLGIIVVDEEQENSYKQTSLSPHYNARDVAIIRAKFSNSILVLCSATLSLETFYNIKYNNFQYHYLKKRYNNSQIPKIKLINMVTEIQNNKIPILSRILIERIQDTLNKKEQIVLLQNRRSYSYIVKCINCNKPSLCPKCNVSLKYHKNKNILQCHHCNYKNKFNNYCKSCNHKTIKTYGVGTQKIEEIIKKIFPYAKILRYDKDALNKKENYFKILNKFENQEADILLGTQMIAKGLDFKNVSLVGIINADLGMLLPDFRAGEKAFQLIYQLIGRSGRHKKNSTAIIQSYNTDDQYINLACSGELSDYYNYALHERKDLNYPPYSRLIKISSTGINKKIINTQLTNIYNKLLLYKNITIMGPADCPIEKINNAFRMHLIIKTNKKDWLKLYKFIINKIGLNQFEQSNKKHKMIIDVDPISFL